MDFTQITIDSSFSEGEKSDIRRVNFEDVEEMKRLRIIEDDPGVAEFVEDLQATDEELLSFAKGRETRVCVAVVGKEGYVDNSEIDKLQGWIYLYPDEEERVLRLKNAGIGDIFEEGVNVIEISYAKFPGAAKGQMSGGLRQVVKTLRRECEKRGEKMVLTAYTDKINVDSKRLLMSAGFEKIGEIEYHAESGTYDEVWMIKI